MSQCNITHPDRDEKYRHYHERIAKLELEVKLATARGDQYERELTSIFERVRQQVTVWLDYPDDKRIYLVGVLREPDQKNEPLI
ncbi:MAG: hypothetical protein RLZ98_3459 [Pseudomonadota bacterium]|jgi:hypothetical protein